jgi:hypothetical protein
LCVCVCVCEMAEVQSLWAEALHIWVVPPSFPAGLWTGTVEAGGSGVSPILWRLTRPSGIQGAATGVTGGKQDGVWPTHLWPSM